MKSDLGKKNAIGDPTRPDHTLLNREIAELTDAMGGSLRRAHQPDGAALFGTSCKVNSRGFKTRYDQIKNLLWKNKTLGELGGGSE